jgi:hypothetical protein
MGSDRRKLFSQSRQQINGLAERDQDEREQGILKVANYGGHEKRGRRQEHVVSEHDVLDRYRDLGEG